MKIEIASQQKAYSVPSTVEERNRLRAMIADFIDGSDWIPPVTLEQLTALSSQFINNAGLAPDLSGWLMVEINNRIWYNTFATIPHERRILLLPQCLKNSETCTAEIDKLGLLCRRCGQCSIALLEEMAEQQGMMSLVAEGITEVSKLVGLFESGEIDAVIGVGCLESLEKTFPLLVENAVPGMAVALNCAGCKDTNVDTDYLKTLVEMQCDTSQWHVSPHHYEQIKTEINQWFSLDNLTHLLGDAADRTSLIAHDWLCGEGKRWRPYLLASVYQAITGTDAIPEQVKWAAIAVEAFHKASLIHDDIEDNDDLRYGKPAVYVQYGVPMAINVGDKLLGDGYSLLAACNMMELVREASAAHIALCHGQGLELEWQRNPRSLTMAEVMRIIENKTVPAFGVALSFAVICAGGDKMLKSMLEQYAYSLGIAYQLLDDLDDFESETDGRLHPTAVLAAICEDCEDRQMMDALFLSGHFAGWVNDNLPLLDKAIAKVAAMAATYRQQALDSLAPLKNVELKRLLFRITKKILK